jgi:general secretion pathway protein A
MNMLACGLNFSFSAMYTEFFHLRQEPFSIAPDPRYLFMSERHREALAHLLYGLGSGGGFVLLTGEIGAGKTTICRCLLEQVPANSRVAYIFNPKLSVEDLLLSICDEFDITPGHIAAGRASVKDYVDALNRFLLDEHARGRNSILIIDEAQNLSTDVLEQLRLLTNLETSARKLLQIILIGQPELRDIVARPELEQLAQRMIARYHLEALSEIETADYIAHRLSVAGMNGPAPFRQAALKLIHQLTHGIPRRINLLCDRALLGAYTCNKREIDTHIVRKAATEIFGTTGKAGITASRPRWLSRAGIAITGIIFGVAAGTLAANTFWKPLTLAKVTNYTSSDQSASTTTAQVDLNEVLDTLPDDETIAWRQLIALWGLTVANQAPCQVAQASGLLCYDSNGGLAELQVLDRPALLRLFDKNNKPRLVLLTELSASSATLRVANANYTVHPLVLTRHFRGNFSTIWNAPPGFANNISIGDRGPAVDWLAVKLADLNGARPGQPNLPFDQTLTKKVKDFQTAQGLKADGVAGPKTIMLINRAASVDEPRLLKSGFPGYRK